MDIQSVFDEMNRRLKTDAFKLDDQRSCRVSVGEGPVIEILEFPEEGRLLLYAVLGKEPVEGKDEFFRQLLRSMYMFKDTLGCSFSLNPDTDELCLQHSSFLDRLTADSFYNLFEDFFHLADQWNEMLLAFRPALAAAINAKNHSEAELSQGLANGSFLQV